jgi:stage IV sporulation protein FB
MFNLDGPGRTRFDWCFRLFGTDVRVHPFFWIVILLIGGDQGDPWFTVYWVVIVFASILVHEFGHVLAMRWAGDRGNIVVLWSCGGLAVSPRATYHRRCATNVAVSAAGPAAGLLFAFAAAALGGAMGGSNHFTFSSIGLPVWYMDFSRLPMLTSNYRAYVHLHHFMNTLLYVNFYWSLVNLLPVYPLDGGQIARAIFEENNRDGGYRRSLQVSMFVAGAVAVLALLSRETYLMFLFGFLAIGSLQALQAVGRRPSRRY